jgi:hypothetical protein
MIVLKWHNICLHVVAGSQCYIATLCTGCSNYDAVSILDSRSETMND